ncbi:MAG: signal peptidase II [Endomicrobium sp.]|jgi:signal peptidase II|uniref:signal peptidase II n=1 Tax=Candidatus Endomicrobiellum cubanum TaxID=3242325 RepID=UPI002823718C|nr:signal peptidase II [Endomicrobium sp.]MDR2395158.1 signal peptidase II [Endomicrobium sp.]
MKKPIILGLILLVLDQFTKYLVSTVISYGHFVTMISFFDFFNIVNIRNTGTAFSMFQGQNFIFSVGIFIILSLITIFFYRSWNKMSKIWQYSFCLIISGGIGNLVDRIFRGAVVDFLDFGIGSLRWPSFNIADSCIFIASCLIIFDILVLNKQKV